MVDKTARPSREQIILEYLKGGVTYRQLEAKYGIDHAHVHRWVRRHQANNLNQPLGSVAGKNTIEWFTPPEPPAPPDLEKAKLAEQLQQAHLKITLLEEIIRLAQDEHGLVLPKKSITKPSKLSHKPGN